MSSQKFCSWTDDKIGVQKELPQTNQLKQMSLLMNSQQTPPQFEENNFEIISYKQNHLWGQQVFNQQPRKLFSNSGLRQLRTSTSNPKYSYNHQENRKYQIASQKMRPLTNLFIKTSMSQHQLKTEQKEAGNINSGRLLQNYYKSINTSQTNYQEQDKKFLTKQLAGFRFQTKQKSQPQISTNNNIKQKQSMTINPVYMDKKKNLTILYYLSQALNKQEVKGADPMNFLHATQPYSSSQKFRNLKSSLPPENNFKIQPNYFKKQVSKNELMIEARKSNYQIISF